MSLSPKLRAAMTECALHAEVLAAGCLALQSHRPFTAHSVQGMNASVRQKLDQIAYRFIKLQDTLVERVLPGLLDAAEEPFADNATFQQKLNRLERLGALDSVENWRLLRETRNQIAHEYPDAPQIQAAMLEALLEGVQRLLDINRRISEFAERLAPPP